MVLKKTISCTVILGLAVSLAACSGGPKSPATDDNKAGEPTAAAKKKFDISYLGTAYGAVFPADGKGIGMINDRFNVNYKPVFVPNADYDAKLSALMAANDMPDIARLGGTGGNYVTWAKQGALLPLDDFIKNDPILSKQLPDVIMNQFKVDGKIYGIPKYFPAPYTQTPVIRKDWLDKLGLKMPTNYQEMKEVAIAFTKKDPDGNGKDDTVGLTLWNYPDASFGAYWNSWVFYHNINGKLIPGIATPARKEVVQILADLYKDGAVSKDFATKKSGDAWKDFFSGKSGIYQMQPYQPGTQGIETLLAADPKAEIVAIPPFKAPDGSQGYNGGKGWYDMTVFSAKLKSDPDKVKRILEMINFGRQFYPSATRGKEPNSDWFYGKQGEGYTLVDGKIKDDYGKGLQPREYLPDATAWPPNDEALELDKEYAIPKLVSAIKSLVEMHKPYKTYIDPQYSVYSQEYSKKYGEIETKTMAEQIKMIMGQRPMSDYDKVIEEWNASAKDLMTEMNNLFKEKNITTQSSWK